jgi:hypothetical protein
LSTLGVFLARGGGDELPNFTTVSEGGGVISRHMRYCTFPVTVSRDGEVVVFAESQGPIPPGIPEGTRVYNTSGSLLFTLDPEFLADVGTGTDKPRTLYASSKYIIQVCHRVARVPNDPPEVNSEGQPIIGKLTEHGAHYVQVYDVDGSKLWEVRYAGITNNVRFIVSDNDEHVLIYVPRATTTTCEVFEIGTGRKERAFEVPADPAFGLSDLSISNDGLKSSLVYTRDESQAEDGLTKTTASIYENGNLTTVFETEYKVSETDGEIGINFSNLGGFAMVTVGDGFRTYNFKSEGY